MKYKMKWIKSEKILPEHSKYHIMQIYCWIFTLDDKFVVVSKDNSHWQFPGGHPNTDEKPEETLVREVMEETNIDIKKHIKDARFFGYYLTSDINDNNLLIKTYLQIRYLLKIPNYSYGLKLKTNEKDYDAKTAHIKYIRCINEEELCELIFWVKDSEEYKTAKSLI